VRAYELVLRPQPTLVLETLDGATLAYIIKMRKGRLPVCEVAVLGLQLASAVAYIHRQGFLHLDVKPSNVVCDGGYAKLIDLSIARVPGRVRKPVGTRPYMAPEQLVGGNLTEAADVWGLGSVLYEAATGRRPFKGTDRDGFQQLSRRAEPARRWRRLPGPLAAAIDACLEPEPAAPTLADLGGPLEDFA
jgi:serine/threonine protein kinase